MPRGNPLDDAALHHFFGNLVSRPVRDGTFFGLLARQCDQLTELFCRNLRGSPRPGEITESFDEGEVLQRELLPAEPAHTPGTNRVGASSQFAGDLFVILPFCGFEDHTSSLRDLLRGAVLANKR